MTITAISGSFDPGLIISSGNPLVALSGSQVAFTTILSGGSATLSEGALADEMTVSKGGVLEGAGDLEGDDSVFGLVGGVTLTGGTAGGGQLTLFSGGTASGLTITGANVANQSLFQIESGASATNNIIASEGVEVVYSGGVASGDIVEDGGYLFLQSATASNETVLSGGTLDFGGRLTSDLTVPAVVTTTTELGGASVKSGGVISLLGATLVSGVTVSLGSGAETIDLTVSKGAVVLGSGGVGGETYVAGSVSGVEIEAGEITLLTGGAASGVVDGGTLQIDAGATATGTIVSGGAFLLDYGSATGTVVSSGGAADLYAADSGDTVEAGGKEAVRAGGAASGMQVLSGGIDYVLVSGTTTGTTVSAGGMESISGGVTKSTTVLSGGLAYVFSGGVASGDIVQNGGKELISSGGVARGTQLLSGGSEYVYSSGVASGTQLSGGKAAVSAGGSTVGATVFSGGVNYVFNSGTTTGTVVSFGGYELVSSGGVASGAKVLFGGQESVYLTGVAVGATVSSGGKEVVYAGGTASGVALLAGGELYDDGVVVFAGAGTLAGTLSGSGQIDETGGGDLLISGAGAAYDGAAVISGGTIELGTAHALGSGYVQFHEPSTGSAVLQIDAADAPAAGGTFANPIYNFSSAGEDIDLRSIAFVAGASATVAGSTLVLSDGGKTYTFDLVGSIGDAYPVLSDGHGGTLIDPRAIDPKVVAFAHATAAFAPSDAAKTALVSSTSPGGATPFMHATGSAAAARF